MSVYVDDMHAHDMGRFGRMKMSHMIADTLEELHVMADKIGVSRRWFQDPSTMNVSHPHYDIALSKRALAVQFGAVEITMVQCAALQFRRRNGLPIVSPAEAEEWLWGDVQERAEARREGRDQ